MDEGTLTPGIPSRLFESGVQPRGRGANVAINLGLPAREMAA